MCKMKNLNSWIWKKKTLAVTGQSETCILGIGRNRGKSRMRFEELHSSLLVKYSSLETYTV